MPAHSLFQRGAPSLRCAAHACDLTACLGVPSALHVWLLRYGASWTYLVDLELFSLRGRAFLPLPLSGGGFCENTCCKGSALRDAIM